MNIKEQIVKVQEEIHLIERVGEAIVRSGLDSVISDKYKEIERIRETCPHDFEDIRAGTSIKADLVAHSICKMAKIRRICRECGYTEYRYDYPRNPRL